MVARRNASEGSRRPTQQPVVRAAAHLVETQGAAALPDSCMARPSEMTSGRLVILIASLGCGPIQDVEVIDATPDPESPIDAHPITSPVDAASYPDAILQAIDAPPPQPDAPLPPRLRVTGTPGEVNLRLGPSTDYPVITTVPEGCLVDPVGAPDNGWMPVSWRGIPGWIHGRYLEPVSADTADCAW